MENRKANLKANIVVIGRARSGKSHLGNQLIDEDIDLDEDIFETSAGVESCTTEVKPFAISDIKIDDVKEKYDITYNDTPGFPDTRGTKNSIKVYGEIINLINQVRPTAIVWVLVPTREKRDAELFKTYSLLMREFSNKGIYCAVLANCSESSRASKNGQKRAKAMTEISNILSDYGLEDFTDNDPFISVNETELKKTFLAIVTKGIELSKTTQHVSKFRTFEELKETYEGEFNASEATDRYAQALRSKIKCKESDRSWHKNRIHDLKIAIASTAAGAGAIGLGLAFFTFGVSAVAAAAAATTSIAGMEIAITDSGNKIESLDVEVSDLKMELDSMNMKDVLQMHVEAMEELSKIYEAMGMDSDAENLMEKVKVLKLK